MKMTAGCISLASAKRVRTSFSPSPTHLDVREDALMEKNLKPLDEATAFARSVLPVP